MVLAIFTDYTNETMDTEVDTSVRKLLMEPAGKLVFEGWHHPSNANHT